MRAAAAALKLPNPDHLQREAWTEHDHPSSAQVQMASINAGWSHGDQEMGDLAKERGREESK